MNNNMLRNFVILLSCIIFGDLVLNLYIDTNILQITSIAFPYLSPSNGWEQRGQWGDMLSGHFSALAFLAVAYSVYLQIVFNKQQRNLDSFKMAIALIESLKNEAILITSRTNTPLIQTMLSTIDDIKNSDMEKIADMYGKSFHDILLLESLFKSISMLSQDLNTKQQDIVLLKTRLMESEYKTLAELFFWCIVATNLWDQNIDGTLYEESKTKSLLENMALEFIAEIGSTGTINASLSAENIEKYHNKISSELFNIFNIENRKPSLSSQIKKCYKKTKDIL